MNGADAVYAVSPMSWLPRQITGAARGADQAPDKATAQGTCARSIDGFAMRMKSATAAQQPLIDALFGHDSIEEIVPRWRITALNSRRRRWGQSSRSRRQD